MRELLQQALDALKESREDVVHWGSYADTYFQAKHDLQGDIVKSDKVIAALEAELAKSESVDSVKLTERDYRVVDRAMLEGAEIVSRGKIITDEEPVAWLLIEDFKNTHLNDISVSRTERAGYVPVYTRDMTAARPPESSWE